MRTISKMSSALVAATALAATAAAPAMSADAPENEQHGHVKSSCSGWLLDPPQELRNDYGEVLGHVEFYYSPANGGENCVITYTYDSDKTYTEAWMCVNEENLGHCARESWDKGWYYDYAGAAYQTKTNGYCVAYAAEIKGDDPTDHRDDASYRSGWDHCG